MMNQLVSRTLLTLLLSTGASLATAPAFASGPTASATASNAVLNDYVKIQQSLSQDTMKDVKESASALEKAATSKEVKDAAHKVANSKDLKEARASFKDLSKAVAPLAKKTKGGDFEVYSCPMANAQWVQKKGSIANPYYGKEMLECGEKLN